MIRILFTGGGTGGHIYPILAVFEELKKILEAQKIDARFYYVGAPGKFKQLILSSGIAVSKIFSAKLRRYFDFKNFIDFLIFPISILQAFWKVFWIMPDVLFSKGGPGSLPVVIACWFYRIPIIVHDSDSIIGLANKLAVKFADKIAVSFSSAAEDLSKKNQNKIILTGNPIRGSLKSNLEKMAAKSFFGFKEDKPLILILGGSQGASKINDFLLNIAGELAKDYLVLQQTGVDNFESVREELAVALKNFGPIEKARYKVIPYFENNLADAYAAADIIVSRSSSGVIFELAMMGIPAILIPLSEKVVGIHQIKNAYEYAKSGAAVVIEEENLKPNIFLGAIERSLKNPDMLKEMSAAAKKFSKPDATKMIANEIFNFINIDKD
ncbi:UDP-N-acetylglucosamine--N-acetylmuramyl-(pentapeptide) pyrophosphoryl-undecaprenol N-acetylglucosamine transferase [Candidatus Wolfebacteria bacterium]|nr:UDP-N-acetylglucosamine--N-acetylmuramyl-(pentapeptide) pyrophosphoryl-undecaprenol N-acetylglucosamine transferase [Candidatus Wolfebacteria bacterium]